MPYGHHHHNHFPLAHDVHVVDGEVCRRLIRVSCEKMVGARGERGGARLHRNLLILHLLQTARHLQIHGDMMPLSPPRPTDFAEAEEEEEEEDNAFREDEGRENLVLLIEDDTEKPVPFVANDEEEEENECAPSEFTVQCDYSDEDADDEQEDEEEEEEEEILQQESSSTRRLVVAEPELRVFDASVDENDENCENVVAYAKEATEEECVGAFSPELDDKLRRLAAARPISIEALSSTSPPVATLNSAGGGRKRKPLLTRRVSAPTHKKALLLAAAVGLVSAAASPSSS